MAPASCADVSAARAGSHALAADARPRWPCIFLLALAGLAALARAAVQTTPQCAQCLATARMVEEKARVYDEDREEKAASQRRKMVHGRSELDIRAFLEELGDSAVSLYVEELETFIYEHGPGAPYELARLLCVRLEKTCKPEEVGPDAHDEL